ncbi:MAG: O-antigen ligase family protein [Solirubrobacteraceae bacterium]
MTIASITLVRLPVFFGAKSLFDPIILLLLVSVVAWGMMRQHRGSFFNRPAIIAFVYAAVIGVALFRGAHAKAYGSTSSAAYQAAVYILFVGFGVVLITTADGLRERNERMLAIALAPVAYIVINVLMNIAGLHSSLPEGYAAGKPAKLLALIGISATRARFPLATSINLFSVVSAASLAAVIALGMRTSYLTSRWIRWLLLLCCAYCLLLGDSRASLVIAIVVAILITSRVRIPSSIVALTVPLLPILVLLSLSLVTDIGLAHALSRGGGQSQEAATATGRLIIWKASWSLLKQFPFEALYGWGAAGHFTSGASFHYVYSLTAEGPEALKQIFTHDVVLQMIFDTGYIGLAILVAAVWSTWRALIRYSRTHPDSPVRALMAILLVVLLSGATEVSPTYYSQEALLSALLIMGAAAGLAATRTSASSTTPLPKTTTAHERALATV